MGVGGDSVVRLIYIQPPRATHALFCKLFPLYDSSHLRFMCAMADVMHSGKFLLSDEDSRLIAQLACDDGRDALMLSLLRYCGMRPSELLGLRVKDVYVASQSIFVVGIKGSLSREIPVHPDLIRRLVVLCDGLGVEERIFKISYQRLVQIWHWWRPAKKGLKSLRHTFGVTLYRRTKNVLLVKQALGHKELASTMIYQGFVHGQDELRAGIYDA